MIMIQRHFGGKRDRRETLIGEFIVMSLFTFLPLAYEVTHRCRRRIYELDSKVERGGQIEQFVQGLKNLLKFLDIWEEKSGKGVLKNLSRSE